MSNFSVSQLSSQLQGSIVKQGDNQFDKLRSGWNGYFEKTPAAIALCNNKEDVARCVNYVAKYNLNFSIRSGGHDYAGKSICDNGLVIDLSPINTVHIDPEKKKAVVGAGTRWRDFDEKAQSIGLATTGGTVSTVGVAGYTLGGGTGYLARKHGLALDNLISAEVVTSNGEMLLANESENSDLFWALRGGSGNFGIVTSFEFQLHQIGPEIMAGQVLFPFEQAGDVLRFYRSFILEASDDITCYAFFLNVPPIDAFPEEYHGKTALSIVTTHIGDTNTAKKELDPLLEFGKPILNAVQPMPYTSAQQMFDEGMAKGNRWYSKALYVNEISEKAINTVLKHTKHLPGPFSVAYFEPMGGAINRVDTEATAFPHRDSVFSFHIFAGWTEPADDEESITWAREFYEAMDAHNTGGVYVNLLGHDEKERVPKTYGPNYSKLTQLKKKWDPDNLFKSNQNIKPT